MSKFGFTAKGISFPTSYTPSSRLQVAEGVKTMTKIFTDEEGKRYESLEGDYTKPNTWVIKPIPHPPAKETYTIEMWQVQSGLNKNVAEHHLDLTPDAAESLAKAIEALLQYCNDTPKNTAMPFFPKYLVDACELARAATQDGSAA